MGVKGDTKWRKYSLFHQTNLVLHSVSMEQMFVYHTLGWLLLLKSINFSKVEKIAKFRTRKIYHLLALEQAMCTVLRFTPVYTRIMQNRRLACIHMRITHNSAYLWRRVIVSTCNVVTQHFTLNLVTSQIVVTLN